MYTTLTIFFILAASAFANPVQYEEIQDALLMHQLTEKYNYPVQFSNDDDFYANLDQQNVPEDALLDVPELIKKYNYPEETYHVTTEDGYILCLHRIPYGKDGPSAEKRQIFYIQHGILSSSADFVLSGPGKALGYVLADAGYDVWLGNSRGTKYSRNHTTLNPDKDDAYWNFSWHEMGIYDLPKTIDFILEKTKQKDMLYVGHSQGTAIFYVMTSKLPEYNQKVTAQFSLAPIAFMNHMFNPLFKFLAYFDGPLGALTDLIGLDEFLPTDSFLMKVSRLFCKDKPISNLVCKNTLFLIGGFNEKQMNTSLIPVILGHTPAGAATKQILHFAQNIKSLTPRFKEYDYGMWKNWKVYKSLTPPSYDLKKVTTPVYLIHGPNDWLSAPKDVDKLYRSLKNARGKFMVADEKFNHLDFMYAKDQVPLCYNLVLGLAAKHKPKN